MRVPRTIKSVIIALLTVLILTGCTPAEIKNWSLVDVGTFQNAISDIGYDLEDVFEEYEEDGLLYNSVDTPEVAYLYIEASSFDEASKAYQAYIDGTLYLMETRQEEATYHRARFEGSNSVYYYLYCLYENYVIIIAGDIERKDEMIQVYNKIFNRG